MTRNKRGVYVRMPVLLYDKLMRLVAARISKGTPATMNSVVCELIERAPVPRAPQ